MNTSKPTTIDDYIGALPEEKKTIIQAIRQTVKAASPQAAEVISYGMPALKGKGILVYYTAFKNHYGLYPTPDGIEAFAAELAGYHYSKGAIQFPADLPIDYDLIARITAYRAKSDAKK